jgi:hypothetical protein
VFELRYNFEQAWFLVSTPLVTGKVSVQRSAFRVQEGVMNTEHSGFYESMRTAGAKTSQTVYSLVGVLNNLREESQEVRKAPPQMMP